MDNKNILVILAILILIVILAIMMKALIFSSTTSNGNNSFSFNNDNETITSTETLEFNIEQEDKRGEIEYTNYTCTIDLNNLSVEGNGVSINNTTITIIKAGTYYFSGTLADGNIIVNAGDEDNVVLVFDNVSITSSNTAVITGVNAKNIYINLVEDTINSFTDSSNYTSFIEDDEPDATIFSKTDLFINGKGTLVVNANFEDGIVSKDDLVITNATIEVTSADDAIRGKDSVDILNSKITINSKEDGIKSSNDTDEGRGYVIIENSDITIDAGDDAIHAEKQLIINSGTININESHEGLEGMAIQINNGDITIKANDDGINGAGSTNSILEINGGNIYVDSDGDGLDSNGSMALNGGTVIVAGTKNSGNGALDFDNSFNVNGGTLIVYGGTGMWQNPSDTSNQYVLCYSVQGSSGDNIEIRDEDGNIIENFVTKKEYSAILISNEKIENGKKYKLYVNGTESSSIETSAIINSQVSGEGFMRGGFENEQKKMRKGM